MAQDTDYVVFVGRFQPFHAGHRKLVDKALVYARKVIVVVGSYRTSKDVKNPWTFEERRDMILKSCQQFADRLVIKPLRDYTYSDLTWITALQNTVAEVVEPNATVKIIGHFKDDSSEYLKFFPQWPLLAQPNYKGINGTDIRHSFFTGEGHYEQKLAVNVAVWMKLWKDANPDQYGQLVSEYAFLNDYRAQWEGTPFPVNHVTTDAVVVQSGHVLLVRRKINPGKGKLALPGGFVGINERIEDGCIRELYEETSISIPKPELRKHLAGDQVFDHPNRSMRGRIITHANFFLIPSGGPLPAVSGGDDASEAFWMPLNDLGLHEQDMFSDHIHIIHHFVNVGR